jgi:hypothetical protein
MALLEHLPQFELHATPHTAKIDRNHTVEVFSGRIGSLHSNVLDAGIVIGRIKPPKMGDRLFDHSLYLRVIGYIALYRKCLVSAGRQFLGSGAYGLLVRVGQRHRSARLSKSLRRRKA